MHFRSPQNCRRNYRAMTTERIPMSGQESVPRLSEPTRNSWAPSIIFEHPTYDDKDHEKHCRRQAQLNCSCDTETHRNLQQSHDQELVSFASLSAISGTFNSLSKVLFIFPSWYLFAIGLKPIFSFRWNLPPLALQARGTWLLESTPYTEDCRWQTGLSPSLVLFSKRLTPAPPLVALLEITIQGRGPRF